jgi:hypothetical protein
MKNFAEEMGITGHLNITRRWNTGQEECLFDDHNVIVSGMGVGLSYLFTGSGSDSILDYQIDRFQVGVSGGTALETSSTYELSGPLDTVADYGTASKVYVKIGTQITNNSLTTDQAFVMIPKNKITRIDDSSVRYTLVLDEDACNDLTGGSGEEVYLSEIGMLMKNPRGNATDQSILVCYRAFSDIRKTSDFSLIFRWTINF